MISTALALPCLVAAFTSGVGGCLHCLGIKELSFQIAFSLTVCRLVQERTS
ncbi:hypothetical protein KC19_1G222300 [Ceratodon purpureus]|uniref:Uncharacterized protein n=1 Tax=Ceratodon purpureus TaxID=3225 RepID=A0A8T0J8Q4_CERPU|nr:hypothetical protein KC19_1G222300 [Ceratodon purpureus]